MKLLGNGETRRVCNICQKKIHDKEEFAELICWRNFKEKISTGYYHIICYRDKFMVPNQKLMAIIQNADQLKDKLRERMNNGGI